MAQPKPKKQLLCTQGNYWCKQGNTYTVTKDDGYVYHITTDKGITGYVHIERMDFCCGHPQGIARFEEVA